MPPKKRTGRVRKYTRRDGTDVRSHNRQMAWKQAGAAWAGAGISGITTLALVFEFGMTLISTVMLVLTALLGFAAVTASKHATANKRKLRATIKARKQPPRRRPSSTRKRPSSSTRKRR